VDAVRRALYRAPHYWSRSCAARAVRGTRWILLRNREDLSAKQAAGLAEVQRTNRPLYRA